MYMHICTQGPWSLGHPNTQEMSCNLSTLENGHKSEKEQSIYLNIYILATNCYLTGGIMQVHTELIYVHNFQLLLTRKWQSTLGLMENFSINFSSRYIRCIRNTSCIIANTISQLPVSHSRHCSSNNITYFIVTPVPWVKLSGFQ